MRVLSRKYIPTALAWAVGLFAAVGGAPAGPHTSGPQRPRDVPARSINELKDDARSELAARVAHLEDLGPRALRDVIAIQYVNDRLIVSSDLRGAGPRMLRMNLIGLPGSATVMSLKTRGQPLLLFNYFDFSNPANISSHVEIDSHQATLQLVYDVVYPDHTLSISLMQADATPAIVLRANLVPEDDSLAIAKLTLTAQSLGELRREHPAEVDLYLRPMFRELHQETAVFGVDEHMVAQALGDDWPVDPQLPGRLQPLLAKLDSPVYVDRAASDKAIRDMGLPAAIYLLKLDMTTFSAEQSARLSAILAPYRALTPAQAKAVGSDPDYLIDWIDAGDATLGKVALARLQKLSGKTVDFDFALTGDPRAAAIDRLRAQFSRATTQPTTKP